jgi:hypothetical protein
VENVQLERRMVNHFAMITIMALKEKPVGQE